MKTEIKERIENCICGNGNIHTRECKNHRRQLYLKERQSRVRKEKRAKHICIYGGCKEKIKSKIVYHQFCEKHKPQKSTLKEK